MNGTRRWVPGTVVVVLGTLAATALTPRAAAAGNAAGQPVIEEIIVTAQKRSENLQRTSAAVTAIPGLALIHSGVTDLRAAQNFIPSVRFQAENASTEIYVRGVGSTLDLPNIEPPTSFNLDGIYLPREVTSIGLFDVAQLEVLPGPQGTLYGRSSLGGAVNVTLRRPTHDPESRALLEAGSDSLLHAGLVENVSLNERWALRGALDYQARDGFQATGADEANDYAVRLSALHEPSDALSIYVWSQGARKTGRSANLVRRGFNGGTFAGDPAAFDTSDAWNDAISSDAPNAAPQRHDSLVTGAEVNWTRGAVQVTYVPSYVYLDWSGRYWLENLPSFLSAHYNQVTQELRVSGTAGSKWQWLTGLYAYRMTNDGRFVVAGFPLADVSRNRLEGVAAFGDATRTLAPGLRVTFGGRYSIDRREGDGLTPFGEPYSARQHFSRADWRLAISRDLGATAMLYGGIQTGYQPGTYNLFPRTDAADNRVKPARLIAYTAGVKSRFADGRWQLNDEIFYYDYRDLLVQSFDLSTALLTTFNAQSVRIYGNQLDLRARAGAQGQLNVSVGYLHARNREFVVPPGIDIGPGTRDFADYSLQYAPDWTVSAGYQQDFAAGDGTLRAALQSRYEAGFWGTFDHARGTHQDAYIKTDASLTYYAPDERWSAGAWIRNIENEPVLAATTTGQFGPYADAFIEPPRTYGVRFTIRFDR